MTKPRIDFDLPEGMDDEELNNILSELNKFSVKLPSEYEMDLAVEDLRGFMPKRHRSMLDFFKRVRLLLSLASGEISFMKGTYWIISIGLFLLGYAITSQDGSNPYLAVMFLSPIPFLLGIMEVFKGREEGMLEIEMSCRISAGEVMMSRLFLISVYNILLNTAFMFLLDWHAGGIDLLKMLLSWMTPLVFVSGLSLWLAVKIKANYAAAIFISGWAAAVLLLITRKDISDRLMGINVLIYLLIILLGIMILFLQAKGILDRYTKAEGGVSFDIDD